MSDIVLETSVAAKLYFAEPDSDRAAALLEAVNAQGRRFVAPVLLRSEMTNAVRRHMRSNRVSIAAASATLDAFLALPVVYFDEPEMYRQALALAAAYSLSTYDAHYVALAQMLTCDVWVADDGVLRAIAGRLIFVRPLASFTGELTG